MKKLFFPLALVLFAPLGAPAQDARIAALKGPVFIRPLGEAQYAPANPDSTLISGDGLKTGPGGAAHLILENGATLLVKERSILILQGDVKRPLVRFKIGEFLIGLRRKLEPGESFRVRTPAAVAAVRGTLFWGKTDKNREARFAALNDDILIRAGRNRVLLKAGEGTRVAFGQAPDAPSPHGISRPYLDQFAVGGFLQGLEEMLPGEPGEE